MDTWLYVSSAPVLAMYGRGSELGLYQTYTSAHLFDTLVAGLAGTSPDCEAARGSESLVVVVV